MPSGRTHDRITLWSLPIIAGLTLALTRSSRLTLVVASGFLVSGLMFGPDLDIHSRQFQRWGWFRWIWKPYQNLFRHRSLWTHGFVIGTTIRVLYLFCGLALLFGLGLGLGWGYQFLSTPHSQLMPRFDLKSIHHSIEDALQWVRPYRTDAIALFLGLEAGAMSHSCSDWIGSWIKAKRKRQAAQPAQAKTKR